MPSSKNYVRDIPQEKKTAKARGEERERCAEWVSRNLMNAREMADEIRSWK